MYSYFQHRVAKRKGRRNSSGDLRHLVVAHSRYFFRNLFLMSTSEMLGFFQQFKVSVPRLFQ